jgi:hypothetical protein
VRALAALLVASGLAACSGPARISLGAAASTVTDGAAGADGLTPSDPDGASDGPPAPEFFLSPTGDDAADGGPGRPWKTFAHALPLLTPGAFLTLLDGTYEAGTTGFLDVRCGMNAVDGEAARRITVRAKNERAAFLRGDASAPPFHVEGCGYWTFEGLRAESEDVQSGSDATDGGSVVFVGSGNHNLVLRKLLARRPNRWKHSHVLRVADGSRDILVEECELYDFHHNAFETQRSDTIVFRRNYINPRGQPDVAGGYGSLDPQRGDYGILFEETRYGLAENNIVENTHWGMGVVGRYAQFPSNQPPPAPLDTNRLLGNVVFHPSDVGVRLESRCSGENPCNDNVRIVLSTVLENDVFIGGAVGLSSSGAVNTRVTNVSVLGATSGLFFQKEANNVGITSSSRTDNSLVVGFLMSGFHADGEDDWAFDHCAGAGNGPSATLYAPDDQHVTGRVGVAPDLGGCLVYLPRNSALRGAGSGGQDVGANVVNRYEDGVLNKQKLLWNPTTGAFPCGAVVPGVNDDPATSCLGVSIRLHVAAADCPMP